MRIEPNTGVLEESSPISRLSAPSVSPIKSLETMIRLSGGTGRTVEEWHQVRPAWSVQQYISAPQGIDSVRQVIIDSIGSTDSGNTVAPESLQTDMNGHRLRRIWVLKNALNGQTALCGSDDLQSLFFDTQVVRDADQLKKEHDKTTRAYFFKLQVCRSIEPDAIPRDVASLELHEFGDLHFSQVENIFTRIATKVGFSACADSMESIFTAIEKISFHWQKTGVHLVPAELLQTASLTIKQVRGGEPVSKEALSALLELHQTFLMIQNGIKAEGIVQPADPFCPYATLGNGHFARLRIAELLATQAMGCTTPPFILDCSPINRGLHDLYEHLLDSTHADRIIEAHGSARRYQLGVGTSKVYMDLAAVAESNKPNILSSSTPQAKESVFNGNMDIVIAPYALARVGGQRIKGFLLAVDAMTSSTANPLLVVAGDSNSPILQGPLNQIITTAAGYRTVYTNTWIAGMMTAEEARNLKPYLNEGTLASIRKTIEQGSCITIYQKVTPLNQKALLSYPNSRLDPPSSDPTFQPSTAPLVYELDSTVLIAANATLSLFGEKGLIQKSVCTRTNIDTEKEYRGFEDNMSALLWLQNHLTPKDFLSVGDRKRITEIHERWDGDAPYLLKDDVEFIMNTATRPDISLALLRKSESKSIREIGDTLSAHYDAEMTKAVDRQRLATANGFGNHEKKGKAYFNAVEKAESRAKEDFFLDILTSASDIWTVHRTGMKDEIRDGEDTSLQRSARARFKLKVYAHCDQVRSECPDKLISIFRLGSSMRYKRARDLPLAAAAKGLSPYFLESLIDYPPTGWMTARALRDELGKDYKNKVAFILDSLNEVYIRERSRGVEDFRKMAVHRIRGSIDVHYHPDLIAEARSILQNADTGFGITPLANTLGVNDSAILKRLSKSREKIVPSLKKQWKKIDPSDAARITDEISRQLEIPFAEKNWKTARQWTAILGCDQPLFFAAIEKNLDAQEYSQEAKNEFKSTYSGARRMPGSLKVHTHIAKEMADLAEPYVKEIRAARKKVKAEGLISLSKLVKDTGSGHQLIKKKAAESGIEFVELQTMLKHTVAYMTQEQANLLKMNLQK